MERSAKGFRYNGLQVLRVVASFMVVVHHASTLVSGHFPEVPVWLSGASGVDIFFALSGFVIFYSSQSLMHRANGWKLFAERRIVRLVPMYWLATGVTAGLMVFVPKLFAQRGSIFSWALASFFFIAVKDRVGTVRPLLHIGWTLNFEVAFYFIFAVALYFRKNVMAVCGTVLGACALASLFKTQSWPSVAFYFDPIVLEFLAGMWIAKLCLRGKPLPRVLAWLVIPCSLTALFVLHHDGLWDRLLNFGLPACLLVYAVASLEASFSGVPQFLLYLADVSYVLYLFHLLVMDGLIHLLLRVRGLPVAVLFLLLIGASLVVSCFIRSWIEAPVFGFLRRHSPFKSRIVPAMET